MLAHLFGDVETQIKVFVLFSFELSGLSRVIFKLRSVFKGHDFNRVKYLIVLQRIVAFLLVSTFLQIFFEFVHCHVVFQRTLVLTLAYQVDIVDGR